MPVVWISSCWALSNASGPFRNLCQRSVLNVRHAVARARSKVLGACCKTLGFARNVCNVCAQHCFRIVSRRRYEVYEATTKVSQNHLLRSFILNLCCQRAVSPSVLSKARKTCKSKKSSAASILGTLCLVILRRLNDAIDTAETFAAPEYCTRLERNVNF